MSEKLVLAKASQGEPLIRVVISEGEHLVYLANPNRLDTIRSGRTDPIGFPCEDVFDYDEAILKDLLGAWEAGRETDEMWCLAKPYRRPNGRLSRIEKRLDEERRKGGRG